jgi:signal transduction histidine kinase
VDDPLTLLAHELRSPVAALRAIADAVGSQGVGLDAATRRRLLELAVAAGRDLERIVVDVAPGSLVLEAVDPAELVRDAATSAGLRGAPVRADVAAELPLLRADPVRLRQALANLIGNALAHSPPGAGVVVAARRCSDGVELAVADEGEGISHLSQESLFEAGVRFADRPGEGIGLAVVRAVAEAHGGRVEVESSPGAGATFRLVLPYAAAGE